MTHLQDDASETGTPHEHASATDTQLAQRRSADVLNKRLLDALEECDRYRARGIHYRWRKASMKKLLALGLVRAQGAIKNPFYTTTEAGREVLRRIEW